MSAAVELDGVVKRFDAVAALSGISGRIESGRLTGLVGPDGAGKTTLMRLIAALMIPTEGRISVAGRDSVREAPSIHRLIGYMPQSFGLYEDLSVMENLRLYADLRNLDPDARAHTFERLLHFTRLGAFTERLAGRLSGGMKQKLGLACALMAEPEVLLLDEPSVGVDPISRRELWAMVQELAGEGMAVVWSTAYLDEAERCSDVLLLNEGRIAFAGPPAELTARLEDRSFRVTDIGSDRRGLLSTLLQLDGVRDGVIQGDALRVVVADTAGADRVRTVLKTRTGTLRPAAPRFEDAFIDLLGGGPGGRSALTEHMHDVPDQRPVMVECNALTKRFGDFTATDAVDFSVQRGEVFGLLGPNGAGKSTTFRMLCGLLRPTSGSTEVAGYDLRDSPGDAKRQLGYMAQKFSLYDLLSVRQNLEFFSGAYGLRANVRRQRIDEMIEVFDLARYLNEAPVALPLGFKQRLALACALMHRPSVLFLDEPTSGVDPITRREFWLHITGLVARGVTVLVTTHFMDEAEYCDRVALMSNARVIALGSPDQLKASVASDERPDPTMEDAFIALVQRVEDDARAAPEAA
ncbi:MAG: ATP-binding cassette domain-containing protein [Pseudomonadales bacterium]